MQKIPDFVKLFNINQKLHYLAFKKILLVTFYNFFFFMDPIKHHKRANLTVRIDCNIFLLHTLLAINLQSQWYLFMNIFHKSRSRYSDFTIQF